jgi:hypothetical protein
MPYVCCHSSDLPIFTLFERDVKPARRLGFPDPDWWISFGQGRLDDVGSKWPGYSIFEP